jgi:hypothetical protein
VQAIKERHHCTSPRARHRLRDVFGCTANSAASTNLGGIAFSCRGNLFIQTLHRQLFTIASRRLLQSSSDKRVAFIDTSAIQETQRQWRNPE